MKNNLKIEMKTQISGECFTAYFVFHKQYTTKQSLLKWVLKTEIHKIIVSKAQKCYTD